MTSGTTKALIGITCLTTTSCVATGQTGTIDVLTADLDPVDHDARQQRLPRRGHLPHGERLLRGRAPGRDGQLRLDQRRGTVAQLNGRRLHRHARRPQLHERRPRASRSVPRARSLPRPTAARPGRRRPPGPRDPRRRLLLRRATVSRSARSGTILTTTNWRLDVDAGDLRPRHGRRSRRRQLHRHDLRRRRRPCPRARRARILTSERGATWTVADSPTLTPLTRASAANRHDLPASGAVVTGHPLIDATTNGGATWTADTGAGAEALSSVACVALHRTASRAGPSGPSTSTTNGGAHLDPAGRPRLGAAQCPQPVGPDLDHGHRRGGLHDSLCAVAGASSGQHHGDPARHRDGQPDRAAGLDPAAQRPRSHQRGDHLVALDDAHGHPHVLDDRDDGLADGLLPGVELLGAERVGLDRHLRLHRLVLRQVTRRRAGRDHQLAVAGGRRTRTQLSSRRRSAARTPRARASRLHGLVGLDLGQRRPQTRPRGHRDLHLHGDRHEPGRPDATASISYTVARGPTATITSPPTTSTFAVGPVRRRRASAAPTAPSARASAVHRLQRAELARARSCSTTRGPGPSPTR